MAWVPHSITWPRRPRPPAGRVVILLQPEMGGGGLTTSDASVTRPVTTMSAPAFRQSTMPQAPEIRVGRERGAEAEFGGPRQQIVALDMRDLRRDAELYGQRANGRCQPGWIEAAGVGDDADPAGPGARPRQFSSCSRNVLA